VRLHGNVTALASGVPALYVVYDSRTREFAELLGIPTLDAYKEEEFSFDAAYDPARYAAFARRYAETYQEMRRFLDENGLAHRMRAVAA
jgi:polysaccharide pyruvyl transferase WcaK-like protein